MPAPPQPVISGAPPPTVQLPVLHAANPTGLVYPPALDTRKFVPSFGLDADRFLHGEAFPDCVYTPYPREFYRDISPNVTTFHPASLDYECLTRMGAAQRITGDASLPACPSFRADFNLYMPAYFKPADRVYLKCRDYIAAGHVDRMVLHMSDCSTYLVIGYCYERMDPSQYGFWFHVAVHATVAMPRHVLPGRLPSDHWYLTSDRTMPKDNPSFYGTTSLLL
jgi:hypothetical protein